MNLASKMLALLRQKKPIKQATESMARAKKAQIDIRKLDRDADAALEYQIAAFAHALIRSWCINEIENLIPGDWHGEVNGSWNDKMDQIEMRTVLVEDKGDNGIECAEGQAGHRSYLDRPKKNELPMQPPDEA